MAPESHNSAVESDENESRASGVSLPMIGMDVNEDLPPAGVPYTHDDFSAGQDQCPVDQCEGKLNRVKVVAEDPSYGAPHSHIETLEVSCLECQRVLFKTGSVDYGRGD